MSDAKTEGYISGFVSIIIAIVLFIVGANSGFNESGELFMAIGTVFGALGAGALLRPATIGRTLSVWFANMAKNAESGSSTVTQKQNRTKGSIQTGVNKGTQNITNNYYEKKK